jgi:hypothetical protein
MSRGRRGFVYPVPALATHRASAVELKVPLLAEAFSPTAPNQLSGVPPIRQALPALSAEGTPPDRP